MKLFIHLSVVFLLLQVPPRAYSQDSLLTGLAQEHHSVFSFNGKSFTGPGWEMINNKIHSAGNVLIGEDHFIKEIPVFAGAIMQNGAFDNLIIEMDPYSTEIIESSIRDLPSEERIAFNKEFRPHFSFYALAPEYELLERAVKNNINLMGAEQVAKFSDRLIFQHLADSTENEKAAKIYNMMSERSKKHFRKFLKDSNHTLYLMTSHFAKQLEVLQSLELTNYEDSVLQDMQISRMIYRDNDHQKRIRLMKHNLMERIDEWYGDKNLSKYGAVHMPSGESLLSIYDVGNLVLNVTDARFKDSYHIAVVAKSGMKGAPFPGYPNSEIDASKGMLSRLSPFYAVVKGDRWHAFDMEPIRNKLSSGDLQLSNKVLERVIKGYDTLIIIPEATAAGF